MIRPDSFLYPAITPATPDAAATLLLVRDSAEGLQVLLSRRNAQARFVPNAYVFPGGRLDADDLKLAQKAVRQPGHTPEESVAAAAAVRECFEELGVLLARNAQGQPVTGAMLAAAQLQRHAPLASQLHALGWTLALDTLWPFAHWTTDRNYPRRFEVPFLLARAPAEQEAVADGIEQFDAVWIRPQDALQRHDQGDWLLVFPTIRSLQRLVGFASTDAVLQAVQTGPLIAPSCPRGGLKNGEHVCLMEQEPGYGELHLVCPNGEVEHELAWQHERAVPLLRHVLRLTAPNAGIMTGPGTNTYVIGEPATGYTVMDPGPVDAAHLQRLIAITAGDIRHIVYTHSHPDHSPGAAPLQQLVVAAGRPAPPIAGMASGPYARADSQFQPEVDLATGDTIVLSGQRPDGTSVTHSLQAVHTPGHAANHLCFLLAEDGLLFSGDHILGGTTTVVIPPDGGMQDFLDSLDKLAALCTQWQIDFILPAHGHVLDDASRVIAQLKAHRLKREAKVLLAIEQAPEGAVDDWLALAYADTPQALWPVARLSLLAHVQRLAVLQPQLGLQGIAMPDAPLAPH